MTSRRIRRTRPTAANALRQLRHEAAQRRQRVGFTVVVQPLLMFKDDHPERPEGCLLCSGDAHEALIPVIMGEAMRWQPPR